MIKSLHFPVVLFLYKRPEATRNLLKVIGTSGTKKLYIFSDGAKKVVDQNAVSEVRKYVAQFQSEHPTMTVIQENAKVNLGLKENIVGGLNTVFTKEVAAIILEDDCLPQPSFFPYVNLLLQKYQHNIRVMSVTGSGIAGSSQYSYDFSKYQQCWGWATWARAWKYYDPRLQDVSVPSLSGHYMQWYWLTMLKLVRVGQVNSWAFIWSYAHFKNNGLAIIPSVNLIENVGFDEAATNTVTKSALARIATSPIKFPLSHPPKIAENTVLDQLIEKKYYQTFVAFVGLMRQYLYYHWGTYAHRD